MNRSWYKPPLQDRRQRLWGVRRRQDAVPREYVGKAQTADRAYNGTDRGTVGPVERALQEFEVRGLVMGAFGEMSSNVVDLERTIVAGMARRWRDDGCRSYEEAMATARFRVRRSLGIEAARGLARLKVKRRDQVVGCGQQAPSEGGRRSAWERRQQAYYERCVGLGVGWRGAGWPNRW